MRNTLIIFISVFILISCKNQEGADNSQVKFTTRQLLLKSDTTINSIAFFSNKIICLQDNGKIILLDTNYNRQDSLESELNIYKPTYLFTLHDTVFIGTKSKTYFIDNTFGLREFKRKERIYGERLFEDSLYYVYGCCVGEWGGSVFFLNKNTKKTYSYFATCASQVLRFKNDYVVCNNLAHMGRSMSFLFVPEPAKLYELTDEKLKNHCNWYTTVDSLKNYWEKSQIGDVKFYSGAYGSMSLVNFPFKDSLYSILCNDSSTFIAVHLGDTTIPRQTILNKSISFHQTQVITVGQKQICLYNLTNGSPFAAYTITGNNSGLIIVDKNRIDILDNFQIGN
jgi:hypothetical protein